jgi:hypothetical protein
MTSAEDTPWVIVYETERDRVFDSPEEYSHLQSLIRSAIQTPGQTYYSTGMDGGNLVTIVTASPRGNEILVKTRPPSGLGAGSSSWRYLPSLQWRVSQPISLDNVFVALANWAVEHIDVDPSIVITDELQYELSSANIGERVVQGRERVFVKVKEDLVVQYAARDPARVRLVVAKHVLLPLKRK